MYYQWKHHFFSTTMGSSFSTIFHFCYTSLLIFNISRYGPFWETMRIINCCSTSLLKRSFLILQSLTHVKTDIKNMPFPKSTIIKKRQGFPSKLECLLLGLARPYAFSFKHDSKYKPFWTAWFWLWFVIFRNLNLLLFEILIFRIEILTFWSTHDFLISS